MQVAARVSLALISAESEYLAWRWLPKLKICMKFAFASINAKSRRAFVFSGDSPSFAAKIVGDIWYFFCKSTSRTAAAPAGSSAATIFLELPPFS